MTLEIELEEAAAQEAVLNVSPRSVRAADRQDPEALTQLPGRLAIGGPWTRPLTAADHAGDDLRAFIEAENAEFDFNLVQLTCTFRAQADEPFHSAFVELRLQSLDDAAAVPTAWSMQPERLTHKRTLERTIKLTASLKILGVGLEGGFEQTDELGPEEVFLQALYEGLPTPSWELRTTRLARIDGLQRFAVVVRTPKRVPTAGTALVRATVNRKRFGLLSYEAALPDGEPLQFQIP